MSTEALQLAPAAGAGIGKLLADRLLAEPDFIDAMVAAAMNGLRATRSFWTGKGENAEHHTEPDSKVQLQALALVMAHMEGEPIKRIIHQHLGGDGSAPDPLAALRESPALLAAVKREIEKAEWRTSGKKAHKAPKRTQDANPVDVEFE